LQSGFATYHNNIRLLLQLTLEKHKDDLPEKINVYNISEFNRKNIHVANHQVPIENIATKNPFVYLPTLQSPPLNLLQNQYRPKFKITPKTRLWFYVGVIAAAWLVILMGSKVVIWYDLNLNLHRLQTQITQNYQQVFPGATNIDDPREKIEHELNALIQNSQDSQFTHLLSRAAVVLHRLPLIHLQSLGFQRNQITLQVSTDNLTNLTLLTRALNEQGLTVKQNQMRNDNKNITAELIIQ
jgi:type II secretion system protein L